MQIRDNSWEEHSCQNAVWVTLRSYMLHVLKLSRSMVVWIFLPNQQYYWENFSRFFLWPFLIRMGFILKWKQKLGCSMTSNVLPLHFVFSLGLVQLPLVNPPQPKIQKLTTSSQYIWNYILDMYVLRTLWRMNKGVP